MVYIRVIRDTATMLLRAYKQVGEFTDKTGRHHKVKRVLRRRRLFTLVSPPSD